MKDSSTVIESIAYAGRRADAGTSAAIDCRTTENTGIVSKPSSAAAGSSAAYDNCGATDQNTASAAILTPSAARRDRLSTNRPSSGAPTADASVYVAPSAPAAP
jgi:hypothetical protein